LGAEAVAARAEVLDRKGTAVRKGNAAVAIT